MSLMESFGSNMLALDEPGKNDLLGSLREPFRQDFVFKRFVSEGMAPLRLWLRCFSIAPWRTLATLRHSPRR